MEKSICNRRDQVKNTDEGAISLFLTVPASIKSGFEAKNLICNRRGMLAGGRTHSHVLIKLKNLCNEIILFRIYGHKGGEGGKGTSELNEKLASSGADLSETVSIREEKMELFRKVHILDETAKEVVLLRLTGAFSFREIGDIFGKNENWARVTFYRAKQKLVKG